MQPWVIYSVIAAASYGLSAIPIKLAVGRGIAASEPVLLASCLGSLAGALLYFGFSGPTGGWGFEKSSILYGGISGLISIVGSFSVIKAMASPLSSASHVMSLVNTNVLFTLIFSFVLLREMPEGMGMMKVVTGAGLICAGSVLLCR